MPLSDLTVRKAQPKEKQYKMADSEGLHLLIHPAGGKYWRFDYRFDGKRKTLAIGTYPDVSLKMARDKKSEARRQIAEGIDPNEFKKATKRARVEASANSFEHVAREWHHKFSSKWSEEHAERLIRRFEKDVFPYIGKKPVSQIDAPELLTVIRRIENRGAIDTAHRALANCGQVFRYAAATGRAFQDPSTALKGALPPIKKKHHASITDPEEIGGLLRAIDGYHGQFITKCALQLAPYCFVRPGELRRAEWKEIDLVGAEWRIPAEKMKARAVHIIPLSKQALSILKELSELTGSDKYVFPSIRSSQRPMSENTVNGALRRLGFTKDEMTGHGFRSMASTLLNEQGWKYDAIERQLAHSERDEVRASYNYAEYLPERREMMQAWADYLDNLKAGIPVS
ncbi:tyrosine-type recombinase/integrase [Methylophaga thalassica]|uniref:tyrosine-type recombinase/integrase n=1 Tax=Methylophaga aminisulfidivorans TaxID=230105 RepID=UPI003A919761